MGIWKFLDAATDDIRLGGQPTNTSYHVHLIGSLSLISFEGDSSFRG